MRNFEYYVEFENEAAMWKFLFLYKDLLIPFNEDETRRVSKQYGNDIGCLMRFGIHKYIYRNWGSYFNRDKNKVWAGLKMNSSDFNNIKGNFRKESIGRYKSLYVLERMGL